MSTSPDPVEIDPAEKASALGASDLGARTASLFAAAEGQDWTRFRSHFAEEAVFKQNTGDAVSIDQALEFLPLLFADGTTIRYENVVRHVAANAVAEQHDAVFTKPDGREIRLHVCVVLRFDNDGKIVRGDEYLDSAQAAALMS